MKRYIDVDKAKEVFHHKTGSSSFDSFIDDVPTADVVEVRHGEWINQFPYYALDGRYLKAQECSICHSIFVSDGNTPYSNHPYCCECGAKMNGGNK